MFIRSIENILKHDAWSIYQDQLVLNAIIRDLQLKYTWIILDVGCGDGRYLNILAKKVRFAVGLDLKEFASWKSRTRNVDYIRADLRFLPFKYRSFNLTLSKDALHHIPRQDIKLALAELFRVMRDEGILRIIEANRYHLHPLMMRKLDNRHNHFTRKEFIELFGTYGEVFVFETFPYLYKSYSLPYFIWGLVVLFFRIILRTSYNLMRLSAQLLEFKVNALKDFAMYNACTIKLQYSNEEGLMA